jgi:3-deoxy-D-manno-octulosonic acid kinase
MAAMIQAQIKSTPDGAIVFDAAALPQAPDAIVFESSYWEARGTGRVMSGGRGGVRLIQLPCGPCVLRHYHRGGMVARVMGDHYLWAGAEATRGFAEFRLLATLHERGLPVPLPVAARYRRRGMHYRADLITLQIERTQTLAQRLAAPVVDDAAPARVGTTIARFHAAGACHADLNAHNVLLREDEVWLIDFDRGSLRTPSRRWQQANLARLQRSLRKLGAARDGEEAFATKYWRPLMAAYEKARVS